MWNLPFNTHKMFIESLGGTHAQVMIYSRYVSFLNSIRKSSKLPVIYLLEKVHLDQNTMTGQNVRHILTQIEENDIFKVKPKQLKKSFKFKELPVDDEWKVNVIKEVVDIKHNVLFLSDENEALEHFSEEELNEILDYVATS